MSGETSRAPFGVIGPVVAGRWYPGEASALRAAVDDLLAAASADTLGDGAGPSPPLPWALIVPHAGFEYSGAVAACGFRSLRGAKPARVIVIGPSHYVPFRGAALPEADALVTPLGNVPIDRDAVAALAEQPGMSFRTRAFAPEHCIEAELPFLQRVLAPGWRIVPVLIGAGTTGASALQVADALRGLVTPDTLVVVSSDFTHFGRQFGYTPFHDRLPERIEALDRAAIDRIRAWDAAGFEAGCDATDATICGRDAIGILLRLQPAAEVESVAYDTSGRMTGDWSHTVSYASLAVRRAEADA